MVAKDGAASGLEVRKAVIQFLSKAWRAALPKDQAGIARRWIDQGCDSLLMILVHEGEDSEGEWENEEPADQILFHFYDSAEWGSELAHHWLAHALVAGEADLTKQLAKLGYERRAGSWYPTTKDLSEARFLVDEGRVGHPEEDGMNWQIPEDAAGMTNYEELSAAQKDAAEKIRSGGSCQCAYCKKSKKAKGAA